MRMIEGFLDRGKSWSEKTMDDFDCLVNDLHPRLVERFKKEKLHESMVQLVAQITMIAPPLIYICHRTRNSGALLHKFE